MKRDLIKQFFNEWRDNVWLIVELLVVFLTIWIIVAYTMVRTDALKYPAGISAENIFDINVKSIPENSPEYFQNEDDFGTRVSDIAELVRRLNENECVEYVAIHNNGVPFNQNYYGGGYLPLDEVDSIFYYFNGRSASPEIVHVLKLNPIDGSDRNSLYEAMKRGEILISGNESYEKQERNPLDLKGKRVIMPSDSSKSYVVGGVVTQLKRYDYEKNWSGDAFIPQKVGKDLSSNIAVRVKPGMGKKFLETFNTDLSLRRARNIYLTDISSIEDMRESSRRSEDMQVRLMMVCIVFLIVTILLGLLGTFWFRVQQRTGEIAIRKVCGATKWQVFGRLFSEGFLMLGIAVLAGSCIMWPFFSKLITFMTVSKPDLFRAELISVAICIFGVVVSIYGPAIRVMKIEPATAIKDE